MNFHTLNLVIAVVIVIGAFGPRDSAAQSLEERVQDLERRVQQLESKQTGAPAASARAAGDGWRSQTNWRALRRGMSEDEVRRILGEPQRVNAGPITFWYYPSDGSADFDSRGRLIGWSEPNR